MFTCPMVIEYKNKSERMAEFIKRMLMRYPAPMCALDHKNPYELISATILSAQCTDRQVNTVTPALFKKYPDPKALSEADPKNVEKLIYSTGFYKNKAQNLIKMAKALVSEYNSTVPADMEKLISLPGVGRKTTNVVLGNAYNIPSMVVDTHVIRISNLLGFVSTKDPEKIEQALMKQVPKDLWINFSHQVIFLGREFCNAKKPLCDLCVMNSHKPA